MSIRGKKEQPVTNLHVDAVIRIDGGASSEIEKGYRHILLEVRKLKEIIVALSEVEQGKLDAIHGQVVEFGAELHAAFDAAVTINEQLTVEIAALSAHIDELNALDVAEDAEFAAALAALTADRDALQATLDTHSADVVAGLDSVSAALGALDDEFPGEVVVA